MLHHMCACVQGVYAVGNFQPSEDRSRSRPPPPTLREPPLSSLPNVSQSAISNSHPGKLGLPDIAGAQLANCPVIFHNHRQQKPHCYIKNGPCGSSLLSPERLTLGFLMSSEALRMSRTSNKVKCYKNNKITACPFRNIGKKAWSKKEREEAKCTAAFTATVI